MCISVFGYILKMHDTLFNRQSNAMFNFFPKLFSAAMISDYSTPFTCFITAISSGSKGVLS